MCCDWNAVGVRLNCLWWCESVHDGIGWPTITLNRGLSSLPSWLPISIAPFSVCALSAVCSWHFEPHYHCNETAEFVPWITLVAFLFFSNFYLFFASSSSSAPFAGFSVASFRFTFNFSSTLSHLALENVCFIRTLTEIYIKQAKSNPRSNCNGYLSSISFGFNCIKRKLKTFPRRFFFSFQNYKNLLETKDRQVSIKWKANSKSETRRWHFLSVS